MMKSPLKSIIYFHISKKKKRNSRIKQSHALKIVNIVY
ncbi:hypothetical protein Calkr_0929 [Caldicellulosiruptor acetigenus I77R1B]|uniref:Uncharacterized protein n=1 Tax=Caldicellulosiruptor acetigenus (strain ATCC 700853 / DSM 12137 / I77R1B) TaxID=632335 RepID=E4S4S5_CALA7|nr:hypothetical protein Calkr_0929 [Caldicellulosiruptor acetigenus I77R1B]